MRSYFFFFLFFSFLLKGQSQSIVIKDAYSEAQIEYLPVNNWIDGSLMTDDKVDNVIYIKKENQYFFRNFSQDKVNVKWFGAKGDGRTNDSEAIQKALNSGFAVYFPPGIYKFNVVISKHVKIEGNGINTVFKPFDLENAILLYKTKSPFWSYSNVLSSVTLESDNRKGIGVAFGNVNLNKKSIEDEYAGNVTFQNVRFQNFDKATYFPFGNIGSNFFNCSWQNNAYGVYSLNNKMEGDIMHGGNKYFYGCEISSNKVGVYVHNTAIGFGGISFNDVIFQMNGINTYVYTDNTYMPIQFINCWDELSPILEKSIEIDFFIGNEKKKKQLIPFGFYFEGKNSSYNFFGGRINNIKLDGDNIKVDAYSVNFEHTKGVGAKDSEISPNSFLNIINPNSEQGLQIHSNIQIKGKINFPQNTLLMKPITVPYRVFLSDGKRKWSNEGEIVKELNEGKELHFTGTLPSYKIRFENKESDNIKIPFTAQKQYMRIEESKMKLSPGFYIVNFNFKVRSGKVLIYIWDRNENQFISLKPLTDGEFHNYSGIGKLDKESELYLDISSEDGNAVDFNILDYVIIKAKDYQELITLL